MEGAVPDGKETTLLPGVLITHLVRDLATAASAGFGFSAGLKICRVRTLNLIANEANARCIVLLLPILATEAALTGDQAYR